MANCDENVAPDKPLSLQAHVESTVQHTHPIVYDWFIVDANDERFDARAEFGLPYEDQETTPPYLMNINTKALAIGAYYTVLLEGMS